jgi:CRISPR-associated endonuclease Cas1
MAATQTVPQPLQDRNCPTLISPRHGVVTLFGYGITVRVDGGHLAFEDGIGAARREGRLPRVRHGLRRLVVIGADGMVSLAALRWLADQDAAFVMLDRDGSALATTGPVCPSDARLRRAQSLAAQSGTDLRITRALIAAKLTGQERIARENLHNATAAQAISQARIALDTAATIPSIRGLEAKAGHAYWSAWKSLPINFPKVDARKVPEHWKMFGTRISPVSGSPRCAINPPNAILNYLYAILESESRLALAAVGLDPGLGFLHVDSRTRDSLACDLMETVRPEVDAYVLDWLTHRLFQRRDFFEMADGTCRLMAGLCVQLSQTAKTWGNAVAPWAELIARTLWATVGKRGKLPATPLTGDHRREGRGGEHTRPVVSPPKSPRLCKVCGVACERTYCASCGASHSREEFNKGRRAAQTPESRAQASATQKAHMRAIRAWKPSKELDWLTKEIYIKDIQPRLRTLKISTLQSALGVSEPYATFIRSGSCIPHQRHWQTLAALVPFPNWISDKDPC